MRTPEAIKADIRALREKQTDYINAHSNGAFFNGTAAEYDIFTIRCYEMGRELLALQDEHILASGTTAR